MDLSNADHHMFFQDTEITLSPTDFQRTRSRRQSRDRVVGAMGFSYVSLDFSPSPSDSVSGTILSIWAAAPLPLNLILRSWAPICGCCRASRRKGSVRRLHRAFVSSESNNRKTCENGRNEITAKGRGQSVAHFIF
jgi:hypothetical protein